jgi:hypothetical protein
VRLISSARRRFAETGPFTENQFALAGFRIVHETFRTRDVRREEIRGELNAFERKIERIRDRADERRFRESRHADEETVSPREERHEQEVRDFAEPDDAIGHAASDRGAI